MSGICCLLCPRIANVRGLCGACYLATRKQINAGTVTDADLVKRGHLLPNRQRQSRPKFNPPPERQ